MQQPILKATPRQVKGSVKGLRRENLVPAVVYSKDFGSQAITVDLKEFDRLLRTHGQNTLIKIDLEGKTSPALVREVQRDTLKDTILHADFLQVSMNEEIQFDLSIVIKGDAKGVKLSGGVLQQQKRTVAAKSLAKDMPEHVELDITGLDIGETLTVGDINMNELVTLLDDPEEVIVSVLAPRLAEEKEEEETDEEADEEAEEVEE